MVAVLPPFEVRGIEPVTLLPTDVDIRIDLSGGSAVEVQGPAWALATWVLGRDDGSTLSVTGGAAADPARLDLISSDGARPARTSWPIGHNDRHGI